MTEHNDTEASLAFLLGDLVQLCRQSGHTHEGDRLDAAYREAAGATGDGWTERFKTRADGAPFIMEFNMELGRAMNVFNRRLAAFRTAQASQ